jgi:hypothetical protein
VQSVNIGEQVEKLRLPEMRKGGDDGGETGGDEGDGRATGRDDQDTRLDRLEKLADLKEKGVLTEEEFAAEKRRAMGQPD